MAYHETILIIWVRIHRLGKASEASKFDIGIICSFINHVQSSDTHCVIFLEGKF